MIGQTDTLLTKPSIGANWSIGTDTSILHNIHNKETNIAIYNRDISDLQQEILQVQEQNTELKISGSLEQIVKELDRHLDPVLTLFSLRTYGICSNTIKSLQGQINFDSCWLRLTPTCVRNFTPISIRSDCYVRIMGPVHCGLQMITTQKTMAILQLT